MAPPSTVPPWTSLLGGQRGCGGGQNSWELSFIGSCVSLCRTWESQSQTQSLVLSRDAEGEERGEGSIATQMQNNPGTYPRVQLDSEGLWENTWHGSQGREDGLGRQCYRVGAWWESRPCEDPFKPPVSLWKGKEKRKGILSGERGCGSPQRGEGQSASPAFQVYWGSWESRSGPPLHLWLTVEWHQTGTSPLPWQL